MKQFRIFGDIRDGYYIINNNNIIVAIIKSHVTEGKVSHNLSLGNHGYLKNDIGGYWVVPINNSPIFVVHRKDNIIPREANKLYQDFLKYENLDIIIDGL